MIYTAIILIAYLLIILFIGLYPAKFSKKTTEDYYVASREFKTLILFAAVFGTNISAVALIGAPGTAYHTGWVVWAYYVSSWAWLSPLLFYTIGSRVWVLGKKFGYITQSEIIGNRWKSKGLSYLVAIIALFYTIPYLMIGSMGGGRVLTAFTGGVISYELGALLIMAVVALYVVLGGMRSTAWTNLVQTFVFLLGGLAIFILVARVLGGPAEITTEISKSFAELLTREKMPWQVFFGFGFVVSLAVPMFPQLFIRLLAGRDQKSLKKMSLIYPFAGFFIWFIVVYIGVWGNIAFPGLVGPQAEQIIPLFLKEYAPIWMSGILCAAILAAAMSTMDAQLLTVGTIFTKDIFKPILESKHTKQAQALSQQQEIFLTKVLVVIMAAIGYILALFRPMQILAVVDWAFGGFAALAIPMIGAIYWKRCTKQAAFISIILSQVFLIGLPLGLLPSSLAFGMLPSFIAVIVALISLVVVTFLTKPAEKDNTEKFFRLFRTKTITSSDTVQSHQTL
jgi:SSS family solute:Na+ symporter